MCKIRFTEEQIIKVLKEHAASLSAGELRGLRPVPKMSSKKYY